MVGLEAESSACKSASEINSNSQNARPSIRLTAISQSCWFANVKLNSLPTEMLIDTGSAVTLISKEVYDNLGGGKPELLKVESTLDSC